MRENNIFLIFVSLAVFRSTFECIFSFQDACMFVADIGGATSVPEHNLNIFILIAPGSLTQPNPIRPDLTVVPTSSHHRRKYAYKYCVRCDRSAESLRVTSEPRRVPVTAVMKRESAVVGFSAPKLQFVLVETTETGLQRNRRSCTRAGCQAGRQQTRYCFDLHDPGSQEDIACKSPLTVPNPSRQAGVTGY